MARRALFTDSESGKWSCRAGSMTARFVPLGSWLKYLPRMPLLKSMSGRSASGSGLGDFFIGGWGEDLMSSDFVVRRCRRAYSRG